MDRLWFRIREPRVPRVLCCVIYAVAALGGLSALTDPPSSIEGEIGARMTLTWGLLLLAGGTIAALSVMPGWWWSERIALILLATGLAMYGAVVAYLHVTSPVGNRLPQLAVIVCLFLTMAARGYEIREFDHEPGR